MQGRGASPGSPPKIQADPEVFSPALTPIMFFSLQGREVEDDPSAVVYFLLSLCHAGMKKGQGPVIQTSLSAKYGLSLFDLGNPSQDLQPPECQFSRLLSRGTTCISQASCKH